MKILFELVIEGGESLKHKFLSAVQNEPEMQSMLLNFFGQGIMWALHLRPEDNMLMHSFRIKELKDENVSEQEKEEEE
jgi:hypothetical protein